MAKKAKIKKRKNLIAKNEVENYAKLEQASEPVQVIRASESSYIFIHGNKVPIRNLSDEYLNTEYDRTFNENAEMRRALTLKESLQFNLSMEQKFRGLK